MTDGTATPGCFITFEGGEGVGKSTQVRLLADWLEGQGKDVLVTREPGGTPGAEAIRALLLDPEGTDWTLPAEALLFAAARADHVARVIRPALARGAWVICDRFIDSTRAYQGGEGALPDEVILQLHGIGSGGLLPDLTVLLEVSPEIATRRLHQRDGLASDRIGGRDAAFHARVARRFAEMAEAEPRRFSRVAGGVEAETVHMAVRACVTQRLGARA
ncbi:dTMP kinase [Alteraurantiacibacter palmitatis]|uniref:Thymidylate kinase n=1 Tax=Alteraurantiacibacter palmitatis TaxID=2054628 RepID=A0ABV7E5H2_9SPHN